MAALPRQKLPKEKRDLLDEGALWFKKDGEAFFINPWPRLILHYQLLEEIANCNRQGCVISVEFCIRRERHISQKELAGELPWPLDWIW